jgi:hypothetical protein
MTVQIFFFSREQTESSTLQGKAYLTEPDRIRRYHDLCPIYRAVRVYIYLYWEVVATNLGVATRHRTAA